MVRLIEVTSDSPLESLTRRLICTRPGGNDTVISSLSPISVPSPKLH